MPTENGGPTTSETDAICPYCRHAHTGAWEWQDDQHECAECGRTFELESEAIRIYHTRELYRCDVCKRLVKRRRSGGLALHYVPGKDGECTGSGEPGQPQPPKGE